MVPKKGSAASIPLKPLDNLFESTLPHTGENNISTLPLNQLKPFENHPFKQYSEDKMDDMIQSVSEHGVLMPVLVRPHRDSGYEIVAGHNRVEASRRAGLTQIPVTIRDLDDETAIVLMVDSNLKQREKLLSSEKAWAYKMKYDAIKRKAGRPTNNLGQLDPNLNKRHTRDIIAEEAGESAKQISRYMRLTELIPKMLEYVDEGRLAFNPAVELSFLDQGEQGIVLDIMQRDEMSPSLSQAKKLHQLSKMGKLDESAIETVMLMDKPAHESISFNSSTLSKYFPRDTTPRQMEQTIVKLLEAWQRKRQNNKER